MSGTCLVTGATGFVGREVCATLGRSGFAVRASVRHATEALLTARAGPETCAIGDMSGQTDWSRAVAGVDSIIHLAARAHHVNESDTGAAHIYRAVNVEATVALARAAAAAGVRRIVFVSSIKVNGEFNRGRPFTAHDPARPEGPYARSKLDAESALLELSGDALEVVIVRPPLVYGPGVRANFLRLMQMVDRGWPLPLGSLRNLRSLVSLWNLSDLLLTMLLHPNAPGRVWLVSDGEDVSTPQLLRMVAEAMNRPLNLWRCPMPVLRLAARVTGHSEDFCRLAESLQVDIERTRTLLKWQPPVPLRSGIERTVDWYLAHGRTGG